MEFQDPDIPLSDKIAAVEKDHEIVHQLVGEYEMFAVSTIEEVLIEVVLSPQFSADEKIPMLDTLFVNCTDRERVEQLLAAYVPSSPIFEMKTILWLLTFDPEKYIDRLFKYLATPTLSDQVRYSQLQELVQPNQKHLPNLSTRVVGVKGAYYYHFLPGISERFRILSAQLFLEYNSVLADPKTAQAQAEMICESLLRIAENPNPPSGIKEKDWYNIRADAADVVHQYSVELQERAFQVLLSLGGSGSVYENKQNIHSIDIREILDFISELKVPDNEAKAFTEIATYLKKECQRKLDQGVQQTRESKNRDDEDGDDEEGDPHEEGDQKQLSYANVSAALGRILLDVARYGKTKIHPGWNSMEIMVRVWTYIQTLIQKDPSLKETLESRVLEELNEMANTCSSGHAIRLFNAITGFAPVSVKMTFADQIAANFKGRMNYRLTHIEDPVEQANVLVDMVDKGPAYQKYYIRNIPLVMAELRREFVPQYVTDDDFDSYIRDATAKFEEGK